MEVDLTPDLEKKLHDLAATCGRSAGDLVREAVAGLIDELSATREMLDARYDDLQSGRVQLVPGDEAFARLRDRSAGRRRHPA